MPVTKIVKKSIRTKLMLTFLLIISFTVIMFVAVFTFLIRNYYYTNIEQTLKDRMNLNIEAYDTYLGYKSLNYRAKFIVENSSIPHFLEAQILDDRGKIIETTSQFSNRGSVETDDVKNALKGKTHTFLGTAAKTKERIMAVSKPLIENDKIVGVMRYVTSVELVDQTIDSYLRFIYFIGFAILGFSFVISYVFANNIAKPIYSLKSSADKIAAGNLDIKAKKYSDDEFGELTDTFNYMIVEIKKTDKLKHDFISSISHELRTPLTSIKGWSETMLSSELDDKEETRMALEIIYRESDRLTGLVEDLLDFSKLEAKRISINAQKFDIVALVKNVINQLQIMFKENKIKHIEELDADKFVYRGDANRIKQVLINIYDNAIKHTYGGDIKTVFRCDEDAIEIKISDNGAGIPAEHLNKVMDEFYKANNKKPGSGIGLSVVKRIVNMHGGVITIESEENVGTDVTIRLPLKFQILDNLE